MNLLKTIAKSECDNVILALSKHEELNFGDIAKLMKHRPTASRVLKELTNAKLLERKVLEDRTVRYRLTQKGKAVSKIVKDLREIEAAFE